MNVNMEWYRIFLYAARSGNLTKAAQELHITQPSVSYAIKQLEELIGVKLFQRLSKGVTVTTEGKALLEYVEKSFSLLEAGEKKLQALKDLTAGELRIGASGPIIKHLLLSPLDRFHEDYPGARIRLSQGKTAEICQQIKEGHMDLGFVHMPLVDHDLEVLPISTIQDCFVVGDAYRGITELPFSKQQLTQTPLLLLSRGSSTRQFVEQWLLSQDIQVEVDIELSSMDMLIEFAKRGYGAAFVTRSYVQEQLAAGELIELQTSVPIPPRTIGVATRRDITLPLIAQRFMELLEHTRP